MSTLLYSCLIQLRTSRILLSRQTSTFRRLSSSHVQKLGLGGHKWTRMDPERYSKVIQTALDQGIHLLEAGQEGGDVALNNALQSLPNIPNDTVVLTRLGYRALHVDRDNKDTRQQSHLTRRWEGDVTVERQTTEKEEKVEIVHNISPPFLQHALDKCVLVQQTNLHTIPMIHNPEVQINHGEENPHDALYDKLLKAFQAMEEAVGEKLISNFGVASNGLSLPKQHPLHLNYEIVLQAALDASKHVHGKDAPHLSMLQLPANLLEPNGISVARQVVESSNKWPSLQVVCMRPLTYYPEQQLPISLVDYPIPTSDGVVYTHEMQGPPVVYQQALNLALGHFDGTQLLEQQSERKLTTEERETLEGCKLLQSVLHDLDVGLEHVSSFAAYEEDLYQKVIPTLYGRFEELDEESSRILQQFFTAHGQAVRYAIASKTRKLLNKQEGIDIDPSTKLQEHALQYILKEPAFSKVIVGCTHPSEVIENVEIAKKLDKE